MAGFIFTQKGYDALKKLVETTEKKLEQVTKAKSESGGGQDAWHDEGFKIGIGEEMTWSKRLAELQRILFSATIVTPEEQNSQVKFGNGVIVEYEDGTIFKFILEGYNIDISDTKPTVSIYSPLGQVVLNAKVNEVKNLQGGGSVTIKKIFLPSKAEEVFK